MNVVVIYSKRTGINFDVTESNIQAIKQAAPQANVFFCDNAEELIQKGIKAEIIICWTSGGGHFICKDYCLYCTDSLKWVFSLSAGMEGVMEIAPSLLPEIKFSNTKGLHATPIAEHVLGFLLATYRGLWTIRENQKKQRWERFVPQELSGKTVGIIGLGSIGCGIAQRCKALGMTVLGVKQRLETIPFVDQVLTSKDMDVVLEQSDVIINALPSTKETYQTFQKERFAKCKQGALFVNIGRGATVETQALTDALKCGHLGGAMLDTIDPEPLPAGHPLWQMENVLISPHMSAESPLYMDRAFQIFIDSIPSYLEHKPLPNEVRTGSEY